MGNKATARLSGKGTAVDQLAEIAARLRVIDERLKAIVERREQGRANG